ncbi:GDP-mannose 4,6-dehydratase [Candidatus Bipolaricaulota bacterium]
MELRNRKILVTGAGGFIGSHLVEALLGSGACVSAMVRYNGRDDWGMLADLPAETLRSVQIVRGDIRDPFFVRRAVDGADCVFHLAALIGIPYSYIAPEDYVSVNVHGTLNILEACRNAGVARVIHTSTSEVYGSARYVPIDEEHPLQGQSPYSASKIGADKIAESYYASFGLPVVTVRPFNTFGPRQSARAFVPAAVSQALTRDRVVMGALDPVRDLTYVDDTVQGLIQIGLCDCEEVIGSVVNLGTGVGHRVGDVIHRVLELVGCEDLIVEQDTSRMRPEKSEVMELVSDNSRARKLCQWQPRWSLEDGLIQTIEWIRTSPDKYRPDTYAV